MNNEQRTSQNNYFEKLVPSTLIVFSTSAVSTVLGLIFSILFARRFGTGFEADAYFFAMSIPNITFGISNALFFTPVIYFGTQLLAQQKHKELHDFFGTALSATAIIFLVLSVVLFTVSTPVMNYFFPGKTTFVLHAAALLVFLFGLASVVNAVLQVHQKWLLAQLLRLFSVFAALAIVPLAVSSVHVMLGFIGGTIVALAVCLFVILNSRLMRVQITNIWNPLLTSTITYGIPLVLGSLFYYLGRTLPLFFAATLPEGSVAILSYAFSFFFTIPILISEPISTVLYPALVHAFHKGEQSFVIRNLAKASVFLGIVLFIVGLLFYVFSSPVVAFLFGHGAFSSKDVVATAHVLSILALAMPAVAFQSIFIALFLSSGKPWLYILSLLLLVLCFTFLAVLFQPTNVSSLAVALVLAYWMVFIIDTLIVGRLLTNKFK